MGLLQTKRVILPITMAATFDHSQCEAFDLKRHMTTAICVGYGAANIGGALSENENSSPLPVMRAADWYTIGFLHNIGLLLMVECNPQMTGEALLTPNFIEASQALFGFNHFDLSAALLAQWGLPTLFHMPLPHIQNSLYRGEYWQISAVLDIALMMHTSSDSSTADIAITAEKWGVMLPPAALEDDKDEALNLINMVL
jgi:HD-like signal output (HDOD) protein